MVSLDTVIGQRHGPPCKNRMPVRQPCRQVIVFLGLFQAEIAVRDMPAKS